MRTYLAASIAALALLISGCITSVQGICPTDGGDLAVFDPALLGDWTVDTDDQARVKDGLKVDLGGKPLRVTQLREGSKTYVIGTPVGPDELGGGPPDIAHLVPIGGARFLDVLGAFSQNKDEKVHHLIKVSSGQEILSFQFMDPSYFLSHPATAGSAVTTSISGHLPLGKGQSPEFSIQFPTLTAAPGDLRKFLEEHANDPELWPAGWTIRWRRLPDPKPGPQAPVTLTLTLGGDGSIRLADQPIPLDRLADTLRARATGSTPPRVVITTAPEVAIATLEPIIAAAKAAGITTIRFEPAPPLPARP